MGLILVSELCFSLREMLQREPGSTFVCAILSSIGVVAFLIESLAPMGLLPVGGVLETVGASFLFLGLRKNFLFWASKDHFA